ncbi:DUF6445 family protein [Fretibacter rubidus]|uniref:DUF6445 family protein n=1 Tax=Fretibacter rubidus TaxID=570162 RepID=UPI003529DB7C
METPHFTVERFGNEGQPVVVIDDFAASPDALLETASHATFEKRGLFYPGIRAPANPQYLTEQGALIAQILIEVFGFTKPAQLTECAYSLVTTKPQDLMPIQALPHYDGLEPQRLALLHYLSGPKTGGTAFYRHDATGFETVTELRFERYKQALSEEAAQNGLPPQDYCRDDLNGFTRIGTVAAKKNRLVIYRGITLHSGDIPKGLPFSTDPLRGRLTINSFLHEA